MSYFLAPSLVELRNEINAAHPSRDKSSDGWVGDTSHQARVSDHNPDYSAGGIVRAIDVDKDGIDTNRLLAIVIRDPRVEYVIWQRKIYQRNRNFVPLAYNGPNPHDKHMHISLRHTATAAAAGGWGYSGKGTAPSAPAPAPSRVSFEQVVLGVIAGQYGNGDDRARRVAATGQNYEKVRAEVNRRLGGGSPAPSAPARKTNSQIAAEVMRGEWGNNPQRSQRLQAAGYSPSAIQAIVNGGGGGGAVRISISQLASQVIAGQWGNGAERERRITSAGYDYAAVRAEVNRRV